MTGFNGIACCHWHDDYNEKALALWDAGHDTLDIAQALRVPECEVSIRIPLILAERRQNREWNFDSLHVVRR